MKKPLSDKYAVGTQDYSHYVGSLEECIAYVKGRTDGNSVDYPFDVIPVELLK